MTGRKALSFEVLRGGMAAPRTKTIRRSTTAIALTAGAGEAATVPAPVVSEGAPGLQAEANVAARIGEKVLNILNLDFLKGDIIPR